MARKAMEVCLQVLKENKKVDSTASVSGTVYLLFSYFLSGLSGAHFFPTTFVERRRQRECEKSSILKLYHHICRVNFSAFNAQPRHEMHFAL